MPDVTGGTRTLVPVVRSVPAASAVASAALIALLAGPSTRENAADPRITTAIPRGTQLLGVTIASGLATVNLSSTFTASSRSSIRMRLSQVVYTVTQFPSVIRVRVNVAGSPLLLAATRLTYRDQFQPAIFVDRPVWGGAGGNPLRVRGQADVFEAQFRIALLDHAGRILVNRPVLATCGSGCWGTFDITLSYDVSRAQWGTLRVWDPSEKDGSPQYQREYPVYLH